MSTRKVRAVFLAAIVLAVGLAASHAAPMAAQPPPGDSAFVAPGGIAALPSFFPALPGVVDQVVPAMIPASPPGNQALISVWARPDLGVFPDTGAIFDSNCNIIAAGVWDGLGVVCFKVQAVDFSTMELKPTYAKFHASGSDRLICDETAFCDLENTIGDGSMAVLLDGGGKDELLRVTATDESGNTRTVQVLTVQTMVAVPPVVEPGQTDIIPGIEGISVVGYRCPDVGRSVLPAPGAGVWFPTSLGDMYDAIYVGAADIGTAGPFYGCGRDTPTNTLDDRVQFQTDLGQMSLQPLMVVPSLATPGADCPQGKSVSIDDGGAWAWNGVGLPPGPPFQMQNCDLDAAPNGTVGYLAVRTADVGRATVTGQQGGLPSTTIHTYVNFPGPPHWLLFYPDPQVASLDDNPFTVVVLDQGLNPVANQAVECHTSPPAAPFAVAPPAVTSGRPGMATFDPGLVAVTTHIIGGEEFDLTCFVQSDPSVSVTATATVPLSWDADYDGVPGIADNCPFVPNPHQENTDATIDNGPGIPADDTTVPNAVDHGGDACDTSGDIDNDTLPDAQDTNPLTGAGLCGTLTANDGHPNPAGGDITNDDDHDGDPAPPMGTDAADNGPSWDTDNDGVRDGVECTLGTNPRDRTDRPNTADCGGAGDTDGDGLQNAWETCGWGTSPTVVNTDGDTRGDCKEAADVDGNGLVNFVGDTMYYAQAVLLPPASFGRTMDFDIDKNGLVDFVGDVMLEAQFALIEGLCK